MISDKYDTCCHCFVLQGNSITDAYLGEHGKETRVFDYDEFVRFLDNPTQKLWNKMFNCEMFELGGRDLVLELVTSN